MRMCTGVEGGILKPGALIPDGKENPLSLGEMLRYYAKTMLCDIPVMSLCSNEKCLMLTSGGNVASSTYM